MRITKDKGPHTNYCRTLTAVGVPKSIIEDYLNPQGKVPLVARSLGYVQAARRLRTEAGRASDLGGA